MPLGGLVPSQLSEESCASWEWNECLRISDRLSHWLGENFGKQPQANVIKNLREADGTFGQLISLQHSPGQNTFIL